MSGCILILDDDPGSARMLSRMVEELGHKAVGISHVGYILDAINKHTFSAAFVDINLGEGPDGIEAAKGIHGIRPAIRLVLMSGDPTNEERVHEAGFKTFLKKPFLLAEIEAALKNNSA